MCFFSFRIDKERSVKSHRRTRSKDLSHHGSSESVQTSENASVSSPKPSRRDSSGGRFSDNDNSKTEKTELAVSTVNVSDNFDPITEDSLCCWLPAGGDCLLLEGCSILGCPRCDESH
jgi:hypothetical protein